MKSPVTDGAKLYPLTVAWSAGKAAAPAIRPSIVMLVLAATLGLNPGCRGTPADIATGDRQTAPVYDRATGRLERLESDQNGDGKTDAVAFMDGARINYVEIDRDFDGIADRWEFYVPNASGQPGPGSPDGRNLLDRAEEMTADRTIVTRRETYEFGLVTLVEEDVDVDGRFDKWEYYVDGTLERLELDLQGAGFPDRRLIYGAGGAVVRVASDPDGDGIFVELDAPPGGSGAGSSVGKAGGRQ